MGIPGRVTTGTRSKNRENFAAIGRTGQQKVAAVKGSLLDEGKRGKAALLNE